MPVVDEDLRVAVEVGDAQLVEGDVLVQVEALFLRFRGRRVERPHPWYVRDGCHVM